jgi:hypothetical protein
MQRHSFGAFRLAAALALGLGLLACGPSAEQARREFGRHVDQPQAPAAPPSSAAGGDADMVNAATPGGPAPPIVLKFSLATRPIVGEPLQIHIALLPDAGSAIRHIYGSFTPGDGLALQSEHSFELNDLAAGVPLHQEVTVVPQQAGILSLTSTLIVDFDTGSVSRIFGIPLIATAPGASAVPAAPASTGGTSSGPPIASSPAR